MDEPFIVARIDWSGSRFGTGFDDGSYGGLRHVIPQKPAPLLRVQGRVHRSLQRTVMVTGS